MSNNQQNNQINNPGQLGEAFIIGLNNNKDNMGKQKRTGKK